MLNEKVCILCEKPFLSRFKKALRCPTCKDQFNFRKGPQHITVERKQVAAWICHIALPENRFEPFCTNDHRANSCLKAVFRGKDGGYVSWNGRLNVYISGERKGTEFPKVGRVRLMEVTGDIQGEFRFTENTEEEI